MPSDRLRDVPVTLRLALAAGFGVEIARKQRRQVAVPGESEKQLLRRHRTGAVNIQGNALCMPVQQLRMCIIVYRRMEFRAPVAIDPDHALQGLQRAVLFILVDPALQDLDQAVQVVGRNTGFFGDPAKPMRDIRMPVLTGDKSGQGRARIGEQHLAHEGNRAGGAFDVGDDGFYGAHAAGS
jgi:hypothetical protein